MCIAQNEKITLKWYLLSKDRFLRATQVDFSQLLLNTRALPLPNSLGKGMPMVPNKKVNVPYLIAAMIIYVIRNDSLNCKLVFRFF